MRATKESAEELKRLYNQHGRLTPRLVVDTADEDREGPLGRLFQWDDEKAADDYRLIQARNLIRVVRIEADGDEVSAYAHVTIEGEGEYHPISVIAKRKDLFESAREELMAKLESAQKSLSDLERACKPRSSRRRSIVKARRGVEKAKAAVETA